MYKNLLEVASKIIVPFSVNSAIANKRSLQILGNIGIHRTLTYMKPIIDYIQKTRGGFLVDYANDQGLGGLFETQKLEKAHRHGVVIVVPHIEMVFSVYALIRKLAPELQVFRANSIAELVGMTKYMREETFKEIKKKYSESFRQKSMNWNAYDILVTAPTYFSDIYIVNPDLFVFDSIPV